MLYGIFDIILYSCLLNNFTCILPLCCVYSMDIRRSIKTFLDIYIFKVEFCLFHHFLFRSLNNVYFLYLRMFKAFFNKTITVRPRANLSDHVTKASDKDKIYNKSITDHDILY